MPTEVLNTLFSLIDPIYDLHLRILRDVEQRVTTWENCLAVQQQHLGCILLSNIDLILVNKPLKQKTNITLYQISSLFTLFSLFLDLYLLFSAIVWTISWWTLFCVRKPWSCFPSKSTLWTSLSRFWIAESLLFASNCLHLKTTSTALALRNTLRK